MNILLETKFSELTVRKNNLKTEDKSIYDHDNHKCRRDRNFY